MARKTVCIATLAAAVLIQFALRPASALTVDFVENEGGGLVAVDSDTFPFISGSGIEDATFSTEIADQGFGAVVVHFGATLLEPGTNQASDTVTGSLSTVTSAAGVKTTLVTLEFTSDTDSGLALPIVGGTGDEIAGGANIASLFELTDPGSVGTPLSSIISFPFVVNVTSDVEVPEPWALSLFGFGLASLWTIYRRRLT